MSALFWLLPVLVVVTAPGSRAQDAPNDSLKAQFYTSVSARNPTFKTRQVARGNSIDTVANSFDYELAAGITGTYGALVFKMDYQYERQDGLNYVNQEYELRHRKSLYEVGARLRDTEEDNFYVLSGYVEARLLGWVGMGVTRQYSGESEEKWFPNGAFLARFSLARNQFHLMKLDLLVRAEYEVNPSLSRIFFYTEIKNFRRGRFALVPFYRHERVKQADKSARSSYQGKIKLTIDI